MNELNLRKEVIFMVNGFTGERDAAGWRRLGDALRAGYPPIYVSPFMKEHIFERWAKGEALRLRKFVITHEKDAPVIFDNQIDDFEPLKWLLNHQGHSVHWALKYEGYKVEEICYITGKSFFWTPTNIGI